jgi:hypothetical protein
MSCLTNLHVLQDWEYNLIFFSFLFFTASLFSRSATSVTIHGRWRANLPKLEMIARAAAAADDALNQIEGGITHSLFGTKEANGVGPCD